MTLAVAPALGAAAPLALGRLGAGRVVAEALRELGFRARGRETVGPALLLERGEVRERVEPRAEALWLDHEYNRRLSNIEKYKVKQNSTAFKNGQVFYEKIKGVNMEFRHSVTSVRLQSNMGQNNYANALEGSCGSAQRFLNGPEDGPGSRARGPRR